MKKNKLFLISLSLLVLLLSACGREEQVVEEEVKAALVEVQSLADSLELKQELSYSAIVSASSEARLSAQTTGIITDFSLEVGEQVEAGQVLAKINEIGTNTILSGQASSNQIRQAIIAVEQAQESYELARSNYENILISSTNDLKQAEIARDQAISGLGNLGLTFEESLKSAELAYETAQIASEQARLSLQNREKQLEQQKNNIEDNIILASASAINTASSVITGINNLIGLDDNNVVNISYRSNLGALESGSYNRVENAYNIAKDSYEKYLSLNYSDPVESLKAAIVVLNNSKELADASKYLFDKSISSANLPQSSPSGVSLSSLQSAASSYQSQINGILSQSQSTLQAWNNLILDNASTLDALQKAYSLAEKQEASAKQNLNNLQAGNNSQKDQANFSVSLAQNQYDNLKVKLNSQIIAAKTQMDSAQLQYNNASVALQGLYDVRSIVSPISGTIIQKLVNSDDTVSPGQLVAVVGQLDGVKLKFFVEPENVSLIQSGADVQVIDSDNKEYQGFVSSVSAQADALTKRFQVEVSLSGEEGIPLLGTVVKVKISLLQNIQAETGDIFLPLSVLEIGQNGNYVFLVDGDKAKKIAVDLKSVIGEQARVSLDASSQDLIIVQGHKFLVDGQKIEVINK
jgi:RND family efflux transporter MFP subunit